MRRSLDAVRVGAEDSGFMKDERTQVTREISGRNCDYHEIVDEARVMFGGS